MKKIPWITYLISTGIMARVQADESADRMPECVHTLAALLNDSHGKIGATWNSTKNEHNDNLITGD